MGEDVVDSPTLLNGYVFGCHTPSNRLLGISEQIGGNFALFWREQIQQLLSDRSGDFLKQSSAIVWRKVIENLSDLLVTQRLHQLFLVLQAQVFKDFGGQLAGQNSQQHRFVIGFKV